MIRGSCEKMKDHCDDIFRIVLEQRAIQMDIVSGAENILVGWISCVGQRGQRQRRGEHLCWMDTVSGADNIIDGSHERSIDNSGVISRA